MDAWEVIKNEVNNLCMDVNRNTFMKMQCTCSFDNDSGNYLIYIKNVSTNYGAKYYVSKVIAESLVDPKSYANQLCRRIKKEFKALKEKSEPKKPLYVPTDDTCVTYECR